MAELMGRPEMSRDPRYATSVARDQHRAEVNALVAEWIGRFPSQEVIEKCETGDVPCGPIYSIADIFEDPQYRARENFRTVQDPRAGEVVIPTSIPKMSETPPVFAHLGAALGEHNEHVYGTVLGLVAGELERLRSSGVI